MELLDLAKWLLALLFAIWGKVLEASVVSGREDGS